MNDTTTHVSRQGLRQSDRGFAKTNEPFSVEARSLTDWLHYLYHFAKYIRFIDDVNAQPTQTWQAALPTPEQATELVAVLEQGGTFSSTLQNLVSRADFSLLLGVLQGLSYAQAQYSALTDSHHQYFLRDILKMTPRTAIGDTAHLALTLIESATSLSLPQGTQFDGGQDADGNNLIYQLTENRLFNQALLADAFTVSRSAGTASGAAKLIKTHLLDTDAGVEWPQAQRLIFGEDSLADSTRQSMLSTGIVVASRVLWLSAGDRSIQLTFDDMLYSSMQAANIALDALPDYFDVYLSTADGEVLLTGDNVSGVSSPAPGIAIFIDPLFAPIAGLTAPSDPQLTLPYVRLEVKTDATSGDMLNWEALSSLIFNQVTVAVTVTGLTPSAVRSDASIVDPLAPFEAFGSSPRLGSRFIFTHPELATKQTSQINLSFEWLDRPSDWLGYYGPYQDYLRVQDPDGNYDAWPNPQVTLTNPYHTSSAQGILDAASETLDFTLGTNTFYPDNLQLPLVETLTDNDNPLQWPYWFSLEIQGNDLGHGIYSQTSEYFSILYSQQVLDEVTATDTTTETPALTNTNLMIEANWVSVPLPYTPQAKSLTLGYSANVDILVADAGETADHRLLHDHPAGLQAANQSQTAQAYRLLPEISSNGYLYLGFTGFTAPQELSVLFEVESVDNTNVGTDTQVRWRYLDDSGWQIFSTDRQSASSDSGLILVDETRELLESGVITFSVPSTAQTATGFPGDNRLWLQCSINRLADNNAPRYTELLGTYAQGATVSLVDGSYAASHYESGLAAETITGPVSEILNLAEAQQPFASKNAVVAETDAAFAIRSAERIRHRARAWSLWDYEHLVLAEFPHIFWTRCYRDATTTPYQVAVDIVPKVNDTTVLKPKAPLYLNDEVKTYLQKLAPPYVTVDVRSPLFEEVELDVIVSMVSGYDPGIVLQQLNTVINETLSPWTTTLNTHEGLSSVIHLTEVTAIIESQPYIDVVVNISAQTSLEGADWVTQTSKDIHTSDSKAILVPAENHQIRTLEQASVVYDGISVMEIEFDFIVG